MAVSRDLMPSAVSPRIGDTGALGVTVRYLTPHSKWSIHSEYQDNLFMLSLSRGGPTIWMSPQDGRQGRHRLDRGGQPQRRGRRPGDRGDQRQARRHPQFADPAADQADAPDRRLLPALLHLQLPRPDRQPARRGHHDAPPQPGGDVLMRVTAQMAMVMNLDKCIGCHTCSVTCEQAWTNRSGVEYVWFNNVETRPGQGCPRTNEDQDRWQGGWVLNRRGRLVLRAGGRVKNLLNN